MGIETLLSETARQDPERMLLWEPKGAEGRWHSYGAVNAEADRLAEQLRVLGVTPGSRVGLLLENSAAWVWAHFAIAKLGAVTVPLATDIVAPALAPLLAHAEVEVLILGRRQRGVLEGLRALGAGPQVVVWDASAEPGDVERQGPLRGPREAAPPELAMIIYTSGSTGVPKGVMLSHQNLLASTRSTVDYLGLGPDDSMLVVLPLYYIYGLSLLYTHLAVGAAVVLDSRFAYPNVVLDTMQRRQVTGFAGVPSTFILLLNKSTLRKRQFPALRRVLQAGGGLAPDLQRALHQIFAPAQVYIMYGCTEAAPRLSYLPPQYLPEKAGSIGRAVPGVELRLVDVDGRQVAPGTEGEILARGPNIMLGYWRDPEGTAEVLREGWYWTGDLGVLDEQGLLRITGRKRDILKVGGHRVSPQEVEDVLHAFPGVLEAAAIGAPDPLLGEAIHAVVVPRDAAAWVEAELWAFLTERLPTAKRPSAIVLADSLPKLASGKVHRAKLQATLASRAATNRHVG
ncbi:MAG: class I adenylate-forming enzyme family protein [Myxococcota bacterium]